MKKRTLPRAEIQQEHTWDLDSVFPNVQAWEAAIQQLQQNLASLKTFQGTLAQGPETLLAFWDLMNDTLQLLGKIYIFASLNYSVDTNNQEMAARNDRARGLFGQTIATTAFAEPELLAIGFEQLEAWMADHAPMQPYAHYLDQLKKQQKHVRSAEVEQVLGMAQDAFGTASATHGILANADMKFETAVDSDGNEYDVTQGSINGLLSDGDRALRRTAWESYRSLHLDFKNSMANALAAGIKQNVFRARVRGYESALDAALQSSFIPTAVFHNLIDTFQKNLPTWHKYWAIRRKALGVDTLHPYDSHAPLSKQSPDVTYQQAVAWIAEGMKPLGDEYVSVLKKGALKDRWIDIYPNQGKRMGAFSSGMKGTHPFIMMSYTDDLFGLSTLAHELGHSMHSYFTWQAQTIPAYTRYGLFVAEVASNFNQAMVRDYLFRTQPDPNFQIAIIEEAMANFYRYFMIMPTLARFELAIHQRVEQGQALNADTLINLMADLFADVYGDEVEFDREEVGITWAAFHTHLYANFYVYQYATGISAAHALAGPILAGEDGAADRYLEFLKAGGSVYPLDALTIAGVDMTSPEPVEKTFGVLAGMVDRLEQLVS